jgi:hypothetical protein
MSRIKNLRDWANPKTYQPGPGRDLRNLDYWSARASENSWHGGDRASNGPMKLPSAGGQVATRPTDAKPKIAHKIDRLMAGTDPSDKNTAGGSAYMRGIRREA